MSYADIFHAMLKGGLTKSARDEVGAVCADYVRKACEAQGLGMPQGPELETLHERGYMAAPDALTPAQCQAIMGRMCSQKVRTPINGVDGSNGWATQQSFPAPTNTRFGHYDFNLIATCPNLSAIIANPDYIALASQYLGCPATVSIVDLWWSYPSDHELGGMQHWHHDRGDFRSVNLFVYLTDVDDQSGPHMYVPQTHDWYLLQDRSAVYGFKEFIEQHRKSDEAMAYWFDEWPKPVTFTGPPGTTFWEDTRGFHKGLPPTKRARLAFEVVYTIIPKFDHPEPIPRQGKPDPLTKYSTRYIYDWKE